MTVGATEAAQERRKMTLWLLAAGIASLLIPLAGAVYLRWSETAGAQGPAIRDDVFERRDNGDKRITPSQAVTVPPSAVTAPPAARAPASSLDYIKTGADLAGKVGGSSKAAPLRSVEAPAAASSTATPASSSPAPAASKSASQTVRKAFTMPKLREMHGFRSLWNNGGPAAGTGSQTSQGLPNVLPAGAANNPQIQQYLQQGQGQ